MRALLLACLLLASASVQAQAQDVEQIAPAAPGLSDTPIRVRVYLPEDYRATQARYKVLYVNDGQDMEAVRMADVLRHLDALHAIERIIVVAVDMPPDRMAGYGLFDRSEGQAIATPTRHGQVGANAERYARWLTAVVVPTIDARYRTLPMAEGRALLGWSLGALSAFGIGWQYPDVFGRVGAFSPSFWLAADATDSASVEDTRIVHRLVDASVPMARPRLFFGVGTEEETDDRDGDGVIDVLDDTRDLLEGWTASDGRPRRSVRDAMQGVDREAAVLFVLEGGRHQQSSWAQMLPAFLRWAYSAGPSQPSR